MPLFICFQLTGWIGTCIYFCLMIFFCNQFQLRCDWEWEIHDPIESFNFESFLWPMEQVWGSWFIISILLCFSNFQIYCHLGDWINFNFIINFCLLFSTNFSCNAALDLAIKFKDSILEAIYQRLNRFWF